MYKYSMPIPSQNMYYDQNNRQFFGGGFAFPFLLGGALGYGLGPRPYYPPYPYYRPYPYYSPYPYFRPFPRFF